MPVGDISLPMGNFICRCHGRQKKEKSLECFLLIDLKLENLKSQEVGLMDGYAHIYH